MAPMRPAPNRAMSNVPAMMSVQKFQKPRAAGFADPLEQ
jgi:hypothetical protein